MSCLVIQVNVGACSKHSENFDGEARIRLQSCEILKKNNQRCLLGIEEKQRAKEPEKEKLDIKNQKNKQKSTDDMANMWGFIGVSFKKPLHISFQEKVLRKQVFKITLYKFPRKHV